MTETHERSVRLGSIAAALSFLLVAPAARADRTANALFEASAGVVVPFGPHATNPANGVVAFPMEPPVAVTSIPGANANDARDRFPHLRLAVVPEILFGEQHQPESADTAFITFRGRLGLRFLAPIAGRFDVISGLGTTLDFWPDVRASLSPEVGVRARMRRCEYDFNVCYARYAVFVAQSDFFATGDNPVGATLLAGFSGW